MRVMILFQLLILSAVLLFSAGCSQSRKPLKKVTLDNTVPPSGNPRFSLSQACAAAKKHQIDIRVMDALQDIAREHVEKKRLLELPGMIYDLPGKLPRMTIENDFRLQILDEALAVCGILTRPAGSDLQRFQSAVEGKKIDFEQSVRWAKLDCIRRLETLGIHAADLTEKRQDILLELTINAGLPDIMIKRFDYTALPDVHSTEQTPVPTQLKQLLKYYQSAPDAALRFADVIFRLPGELLNRKNADFQAAFDIAGHCAAVIKCAIVHDYLEKARSDYDAARKQLSLTPDDKTAAAAMEKARLNWRIAFFRLQHDRVDHLAKYDAGELRFIEDIISLQGK